MGGSEMPPLDQATLRDDVERLAALGPRFAGTEGEAQARALIAAELRAAGLEVATEEFVHLAYEREATCTILGDAASFHCAGLQATASGLALAEAVYVGDGTEAIDGRIAQASAATAWHLASP